MMKILETKRLILRNWEEGDLDSMAGINQDLAVMEHFPATKSRSETKAFVEWNKKSIDEKGFGFFAVELKKTGEFIGFVGLQEVGFSAPFIPAVEIGWRIKANHWGQGLATEAARAALHFAFNDLELEEVVAFTISANIRSSRIMEKLGMSYCGDFDHPKVDSKSLFSRQMLYRIKRDYFLSFQTVRKNICSIYGEKGEKWFSELPQIIEKLKQHWNLDNIVPLKDMAFNYVAKAVRNNAWPVVLKLAFAKKWINDEANALRHFNGQGSIKLLDQHFELNALLLEQAIPGISLKSLYPKNVELVMDYYAGAMKKIHDRVLPSKKDFPNVCSWLEAIDKLKSDQVPLDLLKKAIALKNKLLETEQKTIVLHGDLHHDNVLQNGNEWLVIDPKGVIGEPEFEIAAFDFIHKSEMKNESEIPKLFERRVSLISKKAKLNKQRIKDWVFVRLILSAAWSIEDNMDPGWALKMAKFLQ